MLIKFPKKLQNNTKSIEFIAYLWGICKKVTNEEIIWDITSTTIVYTNLLSAIGLILTRMEKRNNKIVVIIKPVDKEKIIINNKIINDIFHKYSYEHDKALQYLLFEDKDNYNRALLDEFLIFELKKLNLENYEKIKIIISEITANIKMHANPRQGAICSYLNHKEKKIYISICNIGKTFKQNIINVNDYSFENDIDAIRWAFKRLNTTRKNDTSGGIGLYLLRKYMFQINGQIEVVSGKHRALMYDYYNELDDNIFFIDEIKMKSFFRGVMITLKIDFIKSSDDNEKQEKIIKKINLYDF